MNISSTTALIQVDGGNYPVYMNRVRKDNPNVSFPPKPTVEQLSEFGYAVVLPTERPQGDVVTEGKPVEVEGEFKQTWDIREFTAEERQVRLLEMKERVCHEVNVKRTEALSYGLDFEYDDEIIGVKLEDSDRMVLAQLQQQAERLIAQGQDTTTLVFRSRDNETLELTALVISQLVEAALAQADVIFRASWAIKDAANAAETMEQVPTVPTELSGSVV